MLGSKRRRSAGRPSPALILASSLALLLTASAAAQPPSAPSANGPQPSRGQLMFRCAADPSAERLALDNLAAASPSPEQREADLKAARAAIEQASELRRKFLAGEALGPPYQTASRYMTLAATASSERAAELFRRTARDQLSRSHFIAATQRTAWAAGLSDNARAFAYTVIASEDCGVDQANTAWLKAEIERDGWFTISRFGKAGDSAAFLLVQHADLDRPFQAKVLQILEPLVASQETQPKNYAYLYDRVAVGQGRPQRYGTQGRCTGPGVWSPNDVEAADKLDERRASVGLGPEAEYQASFTTQRLC